MEPAHRPPLPPDYKSGLESSTDFLKERRRRRDAAAIADLGLPETESLVLTALAAGGPVSIDRIRSETGLGAIQVVEALQSLSRQGLVFTPDADSAELTTHGQQLVSGRPQA
jgi:hypothetical protein